MRTTLSAGMESGTLSEEDADMMRTEQAQLFAEAMKYLEIAHASPRIFGGSVAPRGEEGQPIFDELETLVRTERLNRGEIAKTPARPTVPAAWEPATQAVFPDYATVHRLSETNDAMALEFIDLMLHFGLYGLVRFLIEVAPELHGFLSLATAASERCQLQLIKAAMLSGDWSGAIGLIESLFGVQDRLREAYVLLGECHYRAAREGGGEYGPALAAFENALSFLPEPAVVQSPPQVPPPKPDPVLHLRISSIYFAQARQTGFRESNLVDSALKQYKLALLVVPTAEAWRNAGICAYMRARLMPREPDGTQQADDRQLLLKEALKYLSQANILDKCRPQINAWLVICAVELGQVQIAKQTLRHVMRFEDHLDSSTALELAGVLVRFSDEHGPDVQQHERGHIVLDGRYAEEAIPVAKVAIKRGQAEDCGRAQQLLGQAHVLVGEGALAVQEFCTAIRLFGGSGPAQDKSRRLEVIPLARVAAARLLGEPQWAAMVEEVIEITEEDSDLARARQAMGLGT